MRLSKFKGLEARRVQEAAGPINLNLLEAFKLTVIPRSYFGPNQRSEDSPCFSRCIF